MWPDERVARLVNEEFIPVRVSVVDQKDEFKRLGELYGARWTPAILVLDANGDEEYRIEGFVTADQLLARLDIGLGRDAYLHARYPEAEKHFTSVVDRKPDDEATAEALYWSGVAEYKKTRDAGALGRAAAALAARHAGSVWATKASVWK